jgi:hypothetical protein
MYIKMSLHDAQLSPFIISLFTFIGRIFSVDDSVPLRIGRGGGKNWSSVKLSEIEREAYKDKVVALRVYSYFLYSSLMLFLFLYIMAGICAFLIIVYVLSTYLYRLVMIG